MSELQKHHPNEKNKIKINKLSRNYQYQSPAKSSINNKFSNDYNNTYSNQRHINIENIKIQSSDTKTERGVRPSIILSKSNLVKNKSFSKFDFNEVLNFNFGSNNPANLKVINTTMLTTNSPDKHSRINNTSIKFSNKKLSLFNKSSNIKMDQTKYLVGYSLSRKMKNDNKNNKGISFLSQDKYFKNKNGMLILPTLSSTLKKAKYIPKIKNIEINKEKENDININKCIEKQDFEKLKNLISEDNAKMKKQISEKLNKLDEKLRKYKLKRPNEETEEGIEKLFHIYNKKRGKKNNITTNLTLEKSDNGQPLINIETQEMYEKYIKNRFNNILLDPKGKRRFLLKTEEEKSKPEKITDFEISTLANRANRKVEKIFPDLCAFNLPKVLNKNKEYNLKLLYDVFIEFKSLLKCGMVHNRNLELNRQGIDFDTFFNCNTKINQQGIALSKKIFKAFNNKTNLNFMSWQNYFEGMMKIKDQNIDNKLDLFFQILDENGDGSFDYNEVYNLSMISLQRILPDKNKNNEENNDNKSDNKSENKNSSEKDEENKEEDVTHLLAEFLTKFVFELVGIDIDGEIPIDLLRSKMDEKNEKSEYLEFFLCADNFA